MDLFHENQRVTEFAKLIVKIYDAWGNKIRVAVGEKGLSYTQTFEFAGSKYNIDFRSISSSRTIYSSSTQSFDIERAPAVFYENLATIMRKIEKQVFSATTSSLQEKAKLLLGSLASCPTNSYFEIEAKGECIGIVHRGVWQFYTREKDNPINIHYVHTWPYNKDSGREIDFIVNNLATLLDQVKSTYYWYKVDTTKFENARTELKSLFIKSKKTGCPEVSIKGVKVLFIGDNLQLNHYLLIKDRFSFHSHSIHEEKYVIDNVDALAEYINKCRDRKESKKSEQAAFFNMNSVLVKKARQLISNYSDTVQTNTMGFPFKEELEITFDTIKVSLSKPLYETAQIKVNGHKLSWPYSGGYGKKEAKLLPAVWPTAEKFFSAEIEKLKEEVINHNNRVIEKMKVDLADQLLIVVLADNKGDL